MENEQKITLARIAVCIALMAAAFIVRLEGEGRPEHTLLTVCMFLYAAAYIVIGGDIVYKAVRNILHGEVFDENFLMSVATVGAFAIGEYPEAVAVMLFYQIGETFQDMAIEKSRRSITSLMDIRPDYANMEAADGSLTQVSPDAVPAGSVIIVKPGEKIPIDGVVISGSSSLDTTALTGESLPRDVSGSSAVLSGTLNMTGLLKIRTTGTYRESTVARILDLVENADTGKARTERFITRFARYYTPAVVGAAVLLAVIPPLLDGGWLSWLHRALVFLVISCPCALVVSIPLTFFAGIGGASRKGILIKGSNYLEALSRLRTMVFDKTGTLTKGNFAVTETVPSEGHTAGELLEKAALAEIYSDHPVAVSLRAAYRSMTEESVGSKSGETDFDKSKVSDTENFAGEGICSVVDGRKVYAGNSKLMNRAGIALPESGNAEVHAASCSRESENKIGTIVHVAEDGQYLGYIIISDSVKPQSADAIAMLKKAGVQKTVMLTGDRLATAEAVAREVGIDEVHAELLPADKVSHVEALMRENAGIGKLAFAGDGINDAPVLKIADVGIAMGGAGSDAAIEAADVVLMDDNPVKVAEAVGISRKTMRIVRQNIVFAIGVKLLFLLLAAIGVASMWEAVFADVGVTVLAVLNALRAMQ